MSNKPDRYRQWEVAVEEMGAERNQLMWFHQRFVSQLLYHTQNSRKSKRTHLTLSIISTFVPPLGVMVMSLSTIHNDYIYWGIYFGIAAAAIVNITNTAALYRFDEQWLASRELAEELKEQYFKLIERPIDFQTKWRIFVNEVNDLLTEELRAFSVRMKVANARLRRTQERHASQLEQRVQRMEDRVVQDVSPQELDDWRQFQSEALTEETAAFANIKQENISDAQF